MSKKESHEPPYSILRLHMRSDQGWCVVDANGAIVETDVLLMRLSKPDAAAAALRLNDLARAAAVKAAAENRADPSWFGDQMESAAAY